jgi:hypothetical protein
VGLRSVRRSGFPKSHNGDWGGTALKPAWEPIIMARKPLIGTVAANFEKHGTGGLNIDGCRVGGDDHAKAWESGFNTNISAGWGSSKITAHCREPYRLAAGPRT